jgi:membrane-associated protease RseP (regulator of RpoE activity)
MAGPVPLLRPRSRAAGSASRETWTLIAAGFSLGALATWVFAPAPIDTVHGTSLMPGVTAEDSARGPVITSVRDGSAAERNGIVPGDIVSAIDGRPVARLSDVRAWLRRDKQPVVRLGIEHDRQARAVLLPR